MRKWHSHENFLRAYLLTRISFFLWELKAHESLVRKRSHESFLSDISHDCLMQFPSWNSCWECGFMSVLDLMRISWDHCTLMRISWEDCSLTRILWEWQSLMHMRIQYKRLYIYSGFSWENIQKFSWKANEILIRYSRESNTSLMTKRSKFHVKKKTRENLMRSSCMKAWKSLIRKRSIFHVKMKISWDLVKNSWDSHEYSWELIRDDCMHNSTLNCTGEQLCAPVCVVERKEIKLFTYHVGSSPCPPPPPHMIGGLFWREGFSLFFFLSKSIASLQRLCSCIEKDHLLIVPGLLCPISLGTSSAPSYWEERLLHLNRTARSFPTVQLEGEKTPSNENNCFGSWWAISLLWNFPPPQQTTFSKYQHFSQDCAGLFHGI